MQCKLKPQHNSVYCTPVIVAGKNKILLLATQSCTNLCDPMDCSTPDFPVLHHLPEFAHTHVRRVDDAIQPSHLYLPLLLLSSVFPDIRVFSKESALFIRWPKYWSFSFSISPYNEYSVLISFRIDWFDLLAVQGTFKCLLQHHSSKASILQHSAFFYGPALVSIHDYWKNHDFDYMDLCWLYRSSVGVVVEL